MPEEIFSVENRCVDSEIATPRLRNIYSTVTRNITKYILRYKKYLTWLGTVWKL